MLKRGHPWVYADALRELPRCPSGTPAILLDNKRGREIARGYCDPQSPLAFRACSVDEGVALDDAWAQRRLDRALELRSRLFGPETTGYRVLHGEGDGVPGLVVDRYDRTAVLQVDGAGPAGFWNVDGVAEWLSARLDLTGVFHKSRERGQEGKILCGSLPAEGESPEHGGGVVPFVENGLRFTTDVRRGQKTGFFLDQRDNRHLIRQLSKDRRVLNVFGYTGGFSIAAGVGGAAHVTTVDLAAPAIAAAGRHWELNALPGERHEGVAADAFEFLDESVRRRREWDIVIVDPPSFAPSEAAVPKATASYRKLIASAARLVSSGGLLAASSCSSHIHEQAFLEICEEGVADARQRGTLIALTNQPPDHPYPLVLPEFRYLKFVLIRID